VTGWQFSLCPPVSSTNKTDRHDIAEILQKVALSTKNQSGGCKSNYHTITAATALLEYDMIF
jgi:hypothetical protein